MKGVSCFNGGFAVQMGGFIFTCGGGGGVPMRGHQFWWEGGEGFEKNHKIRGAPYGPTMGNPEKNHLIIKNNCSILTMKSSRKQNKKSCQFECTDLSVYSGSL